MNDEKTSLFYDSRLFDWSRNALTEFGIFPVIRLQSDGHSSICDHYVSRCYLQKKQCEVQQRQSLFFFVFRFVVNLCRAVRSVGERLFCMV